MTDRLEHLFRRPWVMIALVVGIALLPRLYFAATSPHPGPWDPTHYYLLGQNLHEGREFEIDYIWHYANDPSGVTHPVDHWGPLPGVLVAGGMALGGETVLGAVLPFALLGAAQAGLAAWFARRIGLNLPGQFLAGLGVAFLPWLFLSSLHTDTTTPFGILAFGSLALMWLGLAENGRWLWLGGALAGLATLTRNDGLLLVPTMVVSAALFAWQGQGRTRWMHYAGFFVAFVAVLLPWMLRNQAVLETPWPGSVSSTAFVRDHEEFYTYATEITLARYLEWGIPNILGKMIFELAASVKLMITLAGGFFGVAIGGALVERLTRARPIRWPVMPALIFLLGAFAFYGIFAPFLSQAGSFKKAYLGVMPFLIILGADVVSRHVRSRAALWTIALLIGLISGLQAVDLTRQDFADNARYADAFLPFGEALDMLQAEMDRELILMTRDPWSAQYVNGYRAIMVPQDPLDVILDVADRYGATHILLPVPRDALAGIYDGTESHPRLSLAASIEDTVFRIYEILP